MLLVVLCQGHESEEEEDSRAPAGGAPEGATPRPRNREDDFYDTDDSFIDDQDLVRLWPSTLPGPCKAGACMGRPTERHTPGL